MKIASAQQLSVLLQLRLNDDWTFARNCVASDIFLKRATQLGSVSMYGRFVECDVWITKSFIKLKKLNVWNYFCWYKNKKNIK